MTRTRVIALITLALAPLPALGQTAASEATDLTVVTALAPIAALIRPLVEDTGIAVRTLTPRPAPMATLEGMLRRADPERPALIEATDAAVTLSGLWPQDPVYATVRADNIWVVEIDATRPLDQSGPPIPRIAAPASAPAWRPEPSEPTAPVSHFPWLGPAAATAMADIVAGDLARMAPEDAAAIEANVAQFRADMRQLKAEYDQRFAGLAVFTVYALTDQFAYLTNEFGLFVDGYFLEQDVRWTDEDYAGLTAHLQDRDISTVIHQWQPSEEVAAAVTAAGAEVVVLSSGETMDWETPGAFEAMLRANLDALEEALDHETD